jgi:hypothetical protein
MIDAITKPFIEFSFMRRALVGCLALSLGAPPIGVFLMLRRMSLMGDAMSHNSLCLCREPLRAPSLLLRQRADRPRDHSASGRLLSAFGAAWR